MFGVARFTDQGHEFNAWARRMSPWAAGLLCALVVVMQQFQQSIRMPSGAAPPEHLRVSEEVFLPGIEALTLHAKYAVNVKASHGRFEASWAEVVKGLDEVALTRTDRLRVAIVAGTLEGKDAGLAKLKTVEGELTPGSGLATDCATLARVFKSEKVEPEAERSLVDRHGWFGSLALARSETSPFWAQAEVGAMRMEGVSIAIGLANLGLLLTGVVAVCVMAGKMKKGTVTSGYEATILPSSLYMEMFAVATLIFLVLVCLQVMTLWMTGPASVAAFIFLEMLMWFELSAILWPGLRGVRWAVVSRDLGWTKGEGIKKEVLCGLVIYLVQMGVSRLTAIAIAVVQALFGVESADLKGFPPFESPLSGSWAPVILGTLGAVVWAPVLEETLFRGALYRAIRPKLGAVGAIGLTAVAFGISHPYGISGLVSVTVAGVVFGLAREWRGSLIAPVVAHALYNGTIQLSEISTILAIN